MTVPTPNAANREPDTPWHSFSVEETARRLRTDLETGLTGPEAEKRLAETGPNALLEKMGHSRLQILLEQFANILTLLLIAAAAISFFLGDPLEAVVILLIVLLNGILGFVQEYRAEQSMAALKKMAVPMVRVRRQGHVEEVAARDVVPGDVVLLEAGNRVPADGRVVKSHSMRAMEAALTGESEPVEKEAALVLEKEKALGDRRNMAFSGTAVTFGRGEIAVTATGMKTELGRIATLLQSVTEEKTPLQERLDRLGKWLALAAIALVGVIFALGVLAGQPMEKMLITAVSLAVAAIPEALTAVVTIALSLGAQRMFQRHALIRRLPAVEALGSVTMICSDKTGTLTQNRMHVTALDIAHHHLEFEQRPHAKGLQLVQANGPERSDPGEKLLPTLDMLLFGGALCNDAVLEKDPDADAASGPFHAVGDPTEGALVLAAAAWGIRKPELEKALPRVAELAFDSKRKRMTTVHRLPDSMEEVPHSIRPFWDRGGHSRPDVTHVAFVKGAVDGLLDIATRVWNADHVETMNETWKGRILEAHDRLAANGMRVLGLCLRPLDHTPDPAQVAKMEQDLVFVGLFGMMDPPRPEVREAVLTCRSAGIRPVMITGDHPLTARHIAEQVGITHGEAPFLTGQEMDRMPPEALASKAGSVQIFARVSPEHKLTLVDIYQRQGHIVAMTGDGVNDAPALKKADIGVAMGITGTDVSREASKMVLLDDNYATIVAAVEEGRVVYDNIRKFIRYLLTCNASEIAVMLLWPMAAAAMGVSLGLEAGIALLPLQILWMNLVTDGLPALALGVEKAEKNVMHRPPVSPQDGIFSGGMVPFIVLMGIVLSIGAIGVGLWAYADGDPAWQTLLFTTLIVNQSFLALSVRSEERSLAEIGFFSNPTMTAAFVSTISLQVLAVYVPFFQRIFKTQPLGWRDGLIAAASGVSVFLIGELWKWRMRRTGRPRREKEAP